MGTREPIHPAKGPNTIHYSIHLNRMIRNRFILIFSCFLSAYAYFSVIRDYEKLTAHDIGARVLPFILCSILLVYILTVIKLEFKKFLSDLNIREKLMKSKERSKQLILESLSEGVLEFDLETNTWVTISGKFLEIFFGSKFSPVPVELLDLGLRSWVNLAPEAHRNTLTKTLLDLSHTGGSFITRIEYALPYGVNRTIELRIFSRLKGKSRRAPLGIIAISHRDVSDEIRLEAERKHQESILAEYNYRMRFALDAVKIGVWEWDLNKNTLKWDERVSGIYAFYEERDPTYDDLKNCIHPEDLARAEHEVLEAIRTRSALEHEYRICNGNKEIRFVRSQGKIQYDDAGNPVKIIGLLWDVTEEKTINLALEDSKSRQISSARLAAIGEMASGIAHEINNPLTVIAAKAMLLKKRAESGISIDADVKSIEANIFRISKIVKGLRVFSRDSEKDPFAPERISVILDDALGFCSERFKLNQVELKIEKRIDDQATINCRSTQVAQIVLNLLNNAFDATEKQSLRKVTVQLYEENKNIHILVSDNGPGVPKDVEEKIMLPFFTTKEVGKGTGLGLSISHGLAREHQGELFLDRKTGASCFHLVFPIYNKIRDQKITKAA